MTGTGEIAVAPPTEPPTAPQSPPSSPRRRWLGLTGLELGLLGAFAAVSVWVLGLDVWEVAVRGRVWTGTDGMYVTDQMQYLAWIQSAAHHGLVANLFVLRSTPADFFQPAVALSGLLTAVGLPSTVALLVWTPVAVVATFAAARALAARSLPVAHGGPRAAAVALALFYGSFSTVYGHFGVVGDLFPGFLAWGYPFALLGVACVAFGVLAYDRGRTGGRFSWSAPLFGGLAGSMHPWQGETLALIVAATELADPSVLAAVRGACRSRRVAREVLRRAAGSPRARLAAATLAATVAPLLYYVALDRFDVNWRLGRHASKHGFSFLALAVALAPLVLVALLGYRGRARSSLQRAIRLWPLAALVVYAQSSSVGGSAPQHAFDGVTLPLSVLAIDGCLRGGWRGPRRRLAAVALLVAATVPATAYEMAGARSATRPAIGNPNFITADERAALDFLRRDPDAGGVFTRAYLGATVPGRTGRHSFSGDCIWSQPACLDRGRVARALQAGQLAAGETRRILLASHARFVLSDCYDNSDLTRLLGPLLAAAHRFGCATVWELAG